MRIFIFNPLYTFELNSKFEKYFIRSGSRWPHSGIKKKNKLPHYLPFPFSLAYSAAWLKKEGFEVYTADFVALNIRLDEAIKIIKDVFPQIIFFETTTPTIEMDISLTNKLKKILPSSTIIVGGTHATTFAKEILSKNQSIDFIVKGEYEETLIELVKTLRAKRNFDGIKGIVFRDNGIIKENSDRDLIEPLDKLPFPAYDMFPLSIPANNQNNPLIYWDGFCQHRPAIQMHASRGCPYRCNFCVWNQVMYKNGKYRTFSTQRLMEEIKYITSNYKVKEIYFDDDDFVINRKHVESFCKALIENKIKIKWSAMADAINLDKELLTLMHKSGCIGIKFGIETASKDMIKALGKPLNLDKVKEIIKICARLKIKTHGTFSLGNLGETSYTYKETLEYLKNFDADSIQVSISTPFPGTRFFEIAKEKNMIKTFDWAKYDGKAQEIISYSSFPDAECKRVNAMKVWLKGRISSPQWILRQIYYFFRILKGIGLSFILSQIFDVLNEEFSFKKLK